MKTLEMALKLAKMGKPVFPCSPEDKKPYTKHGFKDASTDADQIRKWWKKHPDAMIGVPTGETSRWWVVDCDGLEGIENFAILCKAHGYTPETRTQDTPSGGCHYFFMYPDDGSIPNSVSKLAEKVDVRGTGGYIIMSPSKRSDGRVYKWRTDFNKIKTPPKWLVEQAKITRYNEDEVDGKDYARATDFQVSERYVVVAIESECKKVASAPKGKRNDTLNKASHSLGQLVGCGATNETKVKRCLLEAANKSGLVLDDGEESVKRTIESGMKAGMSKPRKKQFYTEFDAKGNEAGSATLTEPRWETPIAFDELTLPSLKREYLPPFLGDFCYALAENCQVPVELPLSMSLAAAAIAAQGKFETEVRPGHKEQLSLYMLCALESGNRKTAIVERCSQPIIAYEKEMALKKSPEIEHQKSIGKTRAIAVEKMRKRYDKAKMKEGGKEYEEEIFELEKTIPDVEKIPRFLTGDITPEKLASIMEENQERIGVMDAEGDIFSRFGGRYSQGIPNIDLLLKAYSAESVRVDRKSDGSIIMNHPRLSLGLSVQPVVLIDRQQTRVFRGRGLDARFLYVMPKSPLGRRKIEPDPIPSDLEMWYNDKIHSLLSKECEVDEYGDSVPYKLRLSEKAYESWKQFAQTVEDEINSNDYEGMKDWAGKFPGVVIRLASILHVMSYENPEKRRIDSSTLLQGIKLGRFFAKHTRAAYGLMGTDDDLESAKKIWKWISRHNVDEFTTQECWQATKSVFKHMDSMKKGLAVLIERSYIAEKHQERKGGAGRPAAPEYLVNPLALALHMKQGN